jgi:hypothetical protein
MISPREVMVTAAVACALATACAGQSYLVADQVRIHRIQDLNGDGDAVDAGERLLWGEGNADFREISAYRAGVLAVDSAGDRALYYEDINNDGDALDVGESLLWANGFIDPLGIDVGFDNSVYLSDFASQQVFRARDINNDGDALDVGENSIYAQNIQGAYSVLNDGAELRVVSSSSGQVHVLRDINSDGDALDVGENLPHTSDSVFLVRGIVARPGGGYYAASLPDNIIYRVLDRNGDGDALDYGEVVSYADNVYGSFSSPWGMTRGIGDQVLVANYTGGNVLSLRDKNHDGDALDFGEVDVFANGINSPVGIVALPEGAPTPFHDRVSASNPLLWYKLSESTGNAINSGSLGSTHDGVYHGSINRAAPTSGDDAGAGFNSTDDYIESLGASPLVGNPTFSIETLVFLPADGSAALWGPFLHWGDGGGLNGAPQRTGREVYFSVQNANLNRTYAGFYNAGLRTTSTIPLGEWLHIVWTREGGNSSAGGTTLYINGEIVSLQQDPNLNPGFVTAAGINVDSTVFRINRAADFFGTRHFTGTMDEIALYDRVLSAAEVRDHACSIVGLCGIPGDYNDDGTVDAGDYVLWRKYNNTSTTLPNDSTPGTDASDFTVWRSHFGQMAGSGVGASAAVPEPTTLVLLLMGALGLFFDRHRISYVRVSATRAENPRT